MKRRTFYDYTCRKSIEEWEIKVHMAKGCIIEGTPQEFFDEVEEAARTYGYTIE